MCMLSHLLWETPATGFYSYQRDHMIGYHKNSLVFKETVVLRRWESEALKCYEGQITNVKGFQIGPARK